MERLDPSNTVEMAREQGAQKGMRLVLSKLEELKTKKVEDE